MALIFYMSSIPVLDVPKFSFDPENFIEHAIEYSMLGILLSFGFRRNFDLKYILILVLIVGSLYGISDEIHQSFVPERVFSFVDMTADAFGSFVGCLIYILFVRFRGKQQVFYSP